MKLKSKNSSFQVQKLSQLGQKKYLDILKFYTPYYNSYLKTNPSFLSSLDSYKESSTLINSLLYGQVHVEIYDLFSAIILLSKSDHNLFSFIRNSFNQHNLHQKQVQSVQDQLKNSIFQLYIQPTLYHIFNLDDIIFNSPPLSSQQTVYRGMTSSIFNSLQCTNKKLLFSPKNFFSTSFSIDQSLAFTSTQCCFYKIILPKHSKGIIINYDLHKILGVPKKSSIFVDNQFEFILPRNSVFQVLHQYHVPYQQDLLGFTFDETQCIKKFPAIMRCYTLKLISQPNWDDILSSQQYISSNFQYQIFSDSLINK